MLGACNLANVHWPFGEMYYFHPYGQGIAHVVRCWSLAKEFCVQSQNISCKSHDGWKGILAGFSKFLQSSPCQPSSHHCSVLTYDRSLRSVTALTRQHLTTSLVYKLVGLSHPDLGWLQSEAVNLLLVVSISIWFFHPCLGLPSSPGSC
jgi:hypothetical protein